MYHCSSSLNSPQATESEHSELMDTGGMSLALLACTTHINKHLHYRYITSLLMLAANRCNHVQSSVVK